MCNNCEIKLEEEQDKLDSLSLKDRLSMLVQSLSITINGERIVRGRELIEITDDQE